MKRIRNKIIKQKTKKREDVSLGNSVVNHTAKTFQDKKKRRKNGLGNQDFVSLNETFKLRIADHEKRLIS